MADLDATIGVGGAVGEDTFDEEKEGEDDDMFRIVKLTKLEPDGYGPRRFRCYFADKSEHHKRGTFLFIPSLHHLFEGSYPYRACFRCCQGGC
mmetsp:Transcript_11293/g.9402  ORF Transcript_11293/g.9402 Transcript_11293/m.9402 type:complete len:93 (-) Transcript_11293:379-657(-)